LQFTTSILFRQQRCFAAAKIDGKAIGADIRAAVKVEADALVASGAAPPGLAVVLVGERPDSATYVSMKEKSAAEAGFHSVTTVLSEDVSEAELLRTVQDLNANPLIDGILVQLPLPEHIDQKLILESIEVAKDVDGFHPQNMGALARFGEERRQSNSHFDAMNLPFSAACTPLGCIELIRSTGVELSGKNVVILGRSNIVGLPAAMMSLHCNATVTCCHRYVRLIRFARFAWLPSTYRKLVFHAHLYSTAVLPVRLRICPQSLARQMC
jgi:5,10-methylene-tetrahydrofolate dehydrogenase/methenyl tetrahydrofolate cyclohydrolase